MPLREMVAGEATLRSSTWLGLGVRGLGSRG